MVWPLWHAAWALVCVATLLWRAHHPLAMLVVAYGAQTVAGVVPALAGEPHSVLDVTAVVLLLAYSLGRWASGRGVVAGSCFLLVVHLAREPLYDSSGASMLARRRGADAAGRPRRTDAVLGAVPGASTRGDPGA